MIDFCMYLIYEWKTVSYLDWCGVSQSKSMLRLLLEHLTGFATAAATAAAAVAASAAAANQLYDVPQLLNNAHC